MILTFSKPQFEGLIKMGIKKHTIRRDKHDRWKVDMKIHFWMRNPRNVKNNPYLFGTGRVRKIETITMNGNQVIIENAFGDRVHVNDADTRDRLARDDGFDSWEQFREFFPDNFTGKIIYWGIVTSEI